MLDSVGPLKGFVNQVRDVGGDVIDLEALPVGGEALQHGLLPLRREAGYSGQSLILAPDEGQQLFRVLFQGIEVAHHEADRVIDLMGDPGGKLADGGHLFLLEHVGLRGFEIAVGAFQLSGAVGHALFERLVEFLQGFFRLFALGKILEHPVHMEDLPLLVKGGPGAHQHPQFAAVLAVHFDLEVLDLPFFPHQGVEFPAALGRDIELGDGGDGLDQFFWRVIPQDGGGGGVAVEEAAIGSGPQYPLHRVFEDAAVFRLGQPSLFEGDLHVGIEDVIFHRRDEQPHEIADPQQRPLALAYPAVKFGIAGRVPHRQQGMGALMGAEGGEQIFVHVQLGAPCRQDIPAPHAGGREAGHPPG